ncbi:MAG: hypothetical protein CO098_07130 [Bacteroidetes bacterium CG_4_9_14_3_um_filter_41_19]|nr:MAG: hypothetical protein CO098_07130 [Bacteroidetes bacterium CG_4_9_14_3_um_filter_41_19]
MIRLKEIWNYLFYLTWSLLNKMALEFIQRPLQKVIFFLFPTLKRKRYEIEIAAISTMSDTDSGFNLGFAFGFMYLTTTIIYAIICIYTVGQFDSNVDDHLHYYFIFVLSLAYITNHLLLWRSDIYKKYFEKFDKTLISKMSYLYVILFHIGIAAFFILTIYWTVGFNL